MSQRKITQKKDILEIIGICLIITALISAYGLYYTSREYAKVTETQMNAQAFISDVSVSINDMDSSINVNVLVLNNVSQLDIEIYLIEYKIYASEILITTPNQRDYFGTISSTGGGNGTIKAGEYVIYDVPLSVSQVSTQHSQLNDLMSDGQAYFIVQGKVYYKISGPSELQEYIHFYSVNMVSLDEG